MPNNIIKSELVLSIINKLNNDFNSATLAAEQAHNHATHAESTAETQYDTIGLENAYLAHGQSNRAQVIQGYISQYRQLQLRAFKLEDEIAVGAIVILQKEDKQAHPYFISPISGGIRVQGIQVLNSHTPLSKEMLGKQVGDSFSFNQQYYEIIDLY